MDQISLNTTKSRAASLRRADHSHAGLTRRFGPTPPGGAAALRDIDSSEPRGFAYLTCRKLADPEDPQVPVIAAINELTKQTHSEVTAEAVKQAIHLLNFETGMLVRNAREKYAPRDAA